MMQFFGSIDNPLTEINENSPYVGLGDGGLIVFISNIIKFITIAAGLFVFINLIIAGFMYISSGGDPKKTSGAWSRIYMSLIGLVIIVSSYTLAAILGMVFFGDATAILSPKIYGPGAN